MKRDPMAPVLSAPCSAVRTVPGLRVWQWSELHVTATARVTKSRRAMAATLADTGEGTPLATAYEGSFTLKGEKGPLERQPSYVLDYEAAPLIGVDEWTGERMFRLSMTREQLEVFFAAVRSVEAKFRAAVQP
jgi:hypothetical protein